MNTPLVSVIIPNYNHAQYLEKRIDTVLNQTYQNIEVIILDDKSTDNSLEVIEQYRNHPKVAQIVVNEQNTGSPFKQWDMGINLAKGELIWIAESDDYNELTFLEELITEWNKHNDVVVAFSNYVMFWGEEFSKYKERKNQCFKGDRFVRNRQARGNYILNASGALFSKQKYNKISKEFLNYKSAGDYMFWVEMLKYGSVVKVNKNLTYWRQHNTSVTSKNQLKGILAKEDKNVLEYIVENYRLNKWQFKMALTTHQRYHSGYAYENEEVKQKVYKLWNIKETIYVPSKMILRLMGIAERYLNILI